MEKMKLSDRFITAMFLPKEYDKLLKLKTGKIISYLIFLVLLISAIEFAIPNMAAIAGMGGIKNIILNEVPEFGLKDGVFQFDERLEHKDEVNQIYFLIDTETEKFTKEDIPEEMSQVVMISQSNLVVFNGISGFGTFAEDTFDHYKDITITNQTIAGMAPFLYGFFLIIFIVYFLLAMLNYLLMALLYAGVLYFLIKFMLPNFGFANLYKVALFAQSIGAVVAAVTGFFGNELLMMAGMVFDMFVTVLLINRALMHIKLKEKEVNLR